MGTTNSVLRPLKQGQNGEGAAPGRTSIGRLMREAFKRQIGPPIRAIRRLPQTNPVIAPGSLWTGFETKVFIQSWRRPKGNGGRDQRFEQGTDLR